MDFMRQQGTLLPQRWCHNGSLVAPALADAPVDPLLGPLWMADTAEQVAEGLRYVAAIAAPQQRANVSMPPPRFSLFIRSPPTCLRFTSQRCWGRIYVEMSAEPTNRCLSGCREGEGLCGHADPRVHCPCSCPSPRS